jgi:hypothetical protein
MTAQHINRGVGIIPWYVFHAGTNSKNQRSPRVEGQVTLPDLWQSELGNVRRLNHVIPKSALWGFHNRRHLLSLYCNSVQYLRKYDPIQRVYARSCGVFGSETSGTAITNACSADKGAIRWLTILFLNLHRNLMLRHSRSPLVMLGGE